MARKIIIFSFVIVLILIACSKKATQKVNVITESTSPMKSQQKTLIKETQQEQENPDKSKEAPNTKVISKDYYTENSWNKKILNLQLADLTGDGVDDYIVTILYTDPSVMINDLAEMLERGGIGYVQVYDGSNTSGLDALGTLLWEKEFAAAHPGNIQVSLIQRESGNYLMTSNIYSQMGQYHFDYQVFDLDGKGNINIVKQQSLDYNTLENGEQRGLNEKEKMEIAGFQKNLSAWFQGATLLAAADVNLPKQLISTPEQKYIPEDYYERAFGNYIP